MLVLDRWEKDGFGLVNLRQQVSHRMLAWVKSNVFFRNLGMHKCL